MSKVNTAVRNVSYIRVNFNVAYHRKSFNLVKSDIHPASRSINTIYVYFINASFFLNAVTNRIFVENFKKIWKTLISIHFQTRETQSQKKKSGIS